MQLGRYWLPVIAWSSQDLVNTESVIARFLFLTFTPDPLECNSQRVWMGIKLCITLKTREIGRGILGPSPPAPPCPAIYPWGLSPV